MNRTGLFDGRFAGTLQNISANLTSTSGKSRISSLLTTLTAQLDFIKANYARFHPNNVIRTISNSTGRPLELDEQNSQDTIRIVDYITNSLIQNHTVVVDATTASNVRSSLCSCNGTVVHRPERFFNVSGYEINNIWKLAFFILAFFIGFVSLLLIMVFSLKILVGKINKRKMLKYDIGNYYLPTHYAQEIASQKLAPLPITHPKTAASISMLEFDPDLSSSHSNSNSGLNLIKGNQLLGGGKRRPSSSNSSSVSSSPTKYKARSTSANGGHAGKRHKSSINSRSTSVTSSGSQAPPTVNNHLFSKESNYITEEELIECQKSTKPPLPSQRSQQCYIYGITNRGFLDDSQLSGFYNPNSSSNTTNQIERLELRPSNLIYDTAAITTNNVPSSFRPLPKPTPSKSPSTSKDSRPLSSAAETKSIQVAVPSISAPVKPITSIDDEIDQIDMKKLMGDQMAAYQLPWKPPNDYEALETNTVTGSLANLSSVTTFSEIYSEAKTNNGATNMNSHHEPTTPNSSSSGDKSTSESSSSSSSSYTCSSSPPPPPLKEIGLKPGAMTTTTASSKEFILTCSNTNEHISRSSKITQELEARLRERRQLMESKSDKFQPKLLTENEFTSISQAISLTHLEKKLHNWSTTEKTPNIQPSVIKAAVVSSASNQSCVCPCHAHEKGEKCTHKKANDGEVSKKLPNAGPASTMVNYKNSRKPKIIIDGSSTLPTKRESIRMLIENKAVSENKQKTALEMHLNTLLCSRKTNARANNSNNNNNP